MLRQLTSLDAQFLALETAAPDRPRRRPGDPRPVDGARAARSTLRRHPGADRRAPAAAAAAALAAGRGPARARLPLLGRRRRLRPRLPRARARAARARAPTRSSPSRSRGSSSRPLDRARPLWELYLIHGLGVGHTAMLTKIHHALIDGLSGAEIMGLLLDLAPEGRELPPTPTRRRATTRPTPGELEMLARGLLGLPALPAARAALAARARCPNLDETPFGTLPGAGHGRPRRRPRAAAGHGRDDRPRARRARRRRRRRSTAASPPHRRFAFGQLVARRGQGRSRTRYGVHGQRRRRLDLRRRGAPLADRARRAAGRRRSSRRSRSRCAPASRSAPTATGSC